MKIYLAGYGHPIHGNEEFTKKRKPFNFLLSFFYLFEKDKGFIERYNWIKTVKKEKKI